MKRSQLMSRVLVLLSAVLVLSFVMIAGVSAESGTDGPATADASVSPTGIDCHGTLIGHKFFDVNKNKVQDTGEPSLSGWVITLQRKEGTRWVDVGSKTTDSSGNVKWENIIGDYDYRMKETMQTGWTAVTPNPSSSVYLGDQQTKTIKFGNWIQMDLGDLPDSYGTSLASDGPRHTVGSLYLGNVIDADTNGQPSVDASGDDISTGDEDGTDDSLNRYWVAGGSGCLPITVGGGNGYLSAWIDWGHDGTFSEAGDKIIDNVAVVAGSQNVCFNVPASYAAGGVLYARLRLFATSTPGALPTGLAINGEVEDYRWDAQPLSVQVQSLTASAERSAVTLSWETVSESDNLGFNVYRSSGVDGVWSQLNNEIVASAAPGSSDGASYEYVDATVAAGQEYFYRVEAVDVHGNAEIVGNTSITVDDPGFGGSSRVSWFPIMKK